jgi:hypothetical protein
LSVAAIVRISSAVRSPASAVPDIKYFRHRQPADQDRLIPELAYQARSYPNGLSIVPNDRHAGTRTRPERAVSDFSKPRSFTSLPQR